MLKVMRESFQHLKWILVFIIVIFVLFVFVDWGTQGGAGAAAAESYAARVNGETIPVDDFRRALFFTEQRYQQMYGQPITAEMRAAMGLPRQVLNSLVEERLMLQEARDMSLDATAGEVRREILEMPALSPDGKFVGAEAYEGWVKRNTGFPTVAAFEDEIARGVTLDKMNSALRNAVIITPAAAEAEYRRRNESAKVRYVLLSSESLLPTVSATPEEIQANYRAHSSDYSHPQQRTVKYLLADVARLRSQANPTEEEVRARYDAMKEQFKSGDSVRAQHILLRVDANAPAAEQAAVEKKARDLAAQIRRGADFGALARQHSQDPASSTNAGDLGYFERGRMVAEFENAAFTTPDGQVTEPVKTTYGYHIIKVNEKRPGGYRPMSEVRPMIEQQLREQKAADMARERIAQAKVKVDQARPKTDAELRAFADDVVSFNDTGWFGRNDQILGMGRLPALNDWAFNAKAGDVGTQIESPRGPIVPYLASLREPGISALDEVRQKVETEVKREKARQLAKDRLQSTFAGARTVDATAGQLSLTPVESMVTRSGLVTGLNGNVNNMIADALNSEVGVVKGPVTVDQGAVVFEVLERKKFDPQEFAVAKDSLVSQMQQDKVPKLRAALLARLRNAANVEINAKIVEPNAAVLPIS